MLIYECVFNVKERGTLLHIQAPYYVARSVFPINNVASHHWGHIPYPSPGDVMNHGNRHQYPFIYISFKLQKCTGSNYQIRLLKNTLEKAEGAIKNGQSRDTGNIVYTRHTTKTNKTTTKHRKLKKMSNTDPTKNRGWTQVLSKGK